MTIVHEFGNHVYFEFIRTGNVVLPAAIGVTIQNVSLERQGAFLSIAIIKTHDTVETAPCEFRAFARLGAGGVDLFLGNQIDSVELRIANITAVAHDVQYDIMVMMRGSGR